MIYIFHIYPTIYTRTDELHELRVPTKLPLTVWEQDESNQDCRSGNNSHRSPKLIFSSHTQTQQTRGKKTQSIEWGDRFTASQGQGSSGWMLSWSALFSLYSFLSLRCPLGSHPSPSIPLFCLFYINTIRLGRSPHWYTFSLSLGLPFTRTHVRKHTHTQLGHTHIQRTLLTKCGRVVNGSLLWNHTHILTHCSYHHLKKRCESLQVWFKWNYF